MLRGRNLSPRTKTSILTIGIIFTSELIVMRVLPLFGVDGLLEALLDSFLLTLLTLPWILSLYEPRGRAGGRRSDGSETNSGLERVMWGTLSVIGISLLAITLISTNHILGVEAERSPMTSIWTGIHGYISSVAVFTFFILLCTGLLALCIRKVFRSLKESESRARERENEVKMVVDHAGFPILVLDGEGRIPNRNRKAEEILGPEGIDKISEVLHRVFQDPRSNGNTSKEIRIESTAGDCREFRVDWNPVPGTDGVKVCILHDLEVERQLLAQEAHAQKMESIGQLSAGIAHEINTPTQFVGDNVRFLKGAFEDLLPLLETSEKALDSILEELPDLEPARKAKEAFEDGDFEYLRGEIPLALDQSLSGIGKIAKIVAAMKSFSHPGTEDRTKTDLNKNIEDTITVATNEWKYIAAVELDLNPDLPQVPCFADEINQVVLNLVVNAAHAIRDSQDSASPEKGRILVGTRDLGDRVEVRICDTGGGIPPEIRKKVFDPFFTTKAVGKGTGQGLSIAHNVIVKKHGGRIRFETEMGRGTTFFFELPLDPERPLEPDFSKCRPDSTEPVSESLDPALSPHGS